jgi:ribosomal protein L7Ae-like RNA K-turn-binding protein
MAKSKGGVHKAAATGGKTAASASAASAASATAAAWVRLGLRVSSAEQKAEFLRILGVALSAGCRRGKEVVVGINAVSALLDQKNLAVLCVGRDALPCIHNHLVDAAHLQHVPIVIFPKLTEDLAKAVSVPRASCLGIPKQPKQPQPGDEKVEDEATETNKEASLDALKDLLFDHAAQAQAQAQAQAASAKKGTSR